MHGEATQQHIYDWLKRSFPDGAEWHRPGFHCFRACHPIVQAITTLDALEGEINNGAWGQFLWNTFPNWREILAVCERAYSAMGATDQAAAIGPLAEKLAANEAACEAAIERSASGDLEAEFGQFTAAGYAEVGFTEQLMFIVPELNRVRMEWLSRQSAEVLQSLATWKT